MSCFKFLPEEHLKINVCEACQNTLLKILVAELTEKNIFTVKMYTYMGLEILY